MSLKFLKCTHCGNIVTMAVDKGVPILCCGEKMNPMLAGTVDAATEKHVPVVAVNGDSVLVSVGEVEHPMLEEHSIQFVALETTQGQYVKNLVVGECPKAEFKLAEGETAVAAYEYCNLHGLWEQKI